MLTNVTIYLVLNGQKKVIPSHLFTFTHTSGRSNLIWSTKSKRDHSKVYTSVRLGYVNIQLKHFSQQNESQDTEASFKFMNFDC